MFVKDCFHTDEGAQLQGLFKREKLNESVSYKCVIPSNYIKTVLYKIFIYDINWTVLVAKAWVQIHQFKV